MKTRREHLSVLPLQKRLQAYEAIRELNPYGEGLNYCLNMACDQDSVIGGAFTYARTKQGHDYWCALSTKYFK